MLVCVYYRVAAGDSQRVISGVREFQRTLHRRDSAVEAEVLLRCDLTSQAFPASPPDARPRSAPPHDPPVDAVDPGADATVMETYRLPLLAAAGPAAEAVVRAFLATLATASQPMDRLLLGARHVELFAPCVL
jgi:hypothetical protein